MPVLEVDHIGAKPADGAVDRPYGPQLTHWLAQAGSPERCKRHARWGCEAVDEVRGYDEQHVRRCAERRREKQ